MPPRQITSESLESFAEKELARLQSTVYRVPENLLPFNILDKAVQIGMKKGPKDGVTKSIATDLFSVLIKYDPAHAIEIEAKNAYGYGPLHPFTLQAVRRAAAVLVNGDEEKGIRKGDKKAAYTEGAFWLKETVDEFRKVREKTYDAQVTSRVDTSALAAARTNHGRGNSSKIAPVTSFGRPALSLSPEYREQEEVMRDSVVVLSLVRKDISNLNKDLRSELGKRTPTEQIRRLYDALDRKISDAESIMENAGINADELAGLKRDPKPFFTVPKWLSSIVSSPQLDFETLEKRMNAVEFGAETLSIIEYNVACEKGHDTEKIRELEEKVTIYARVFDLDKDPSKFLTKFTTKQVSRDILLKNFANFIDAHNEAKHEKIAKI